ncbi:MAG: YajD family HNH nuclease [Gammaproteobacteria bacterium]
MAAGKPPAKGRDLDQVVAAARRQREARERDYREQALKLYPWVCGRCSREFTRENLHELTVHHRDHDHDNNPADGSNWELLCLYCHDNEHMRHFGELRHSDAVFEKDRAQAATHQPFANLRDALGRKRGD